MEKRTFRQWTRLGTSGVCIVFALSLVPMDAQAGPSVSWWNTDWAFRKVVTVTNPSSSLLSDFQVLVLLNTSELISAGKMNGNGSDIRFVNGSEALSYWIESGMQSAQTRIWVKVPAIPASGTAELRMYYGNPSASSTSSGEATFNFFDDFNGTALNPAKWEWSEASDGKGKIYVENSFIRFWNDGEAYYGGGACVWSKNMIMKPPLVMETLGTYFINSGTNVNMNIILSDVTGHVEKNGGRFCYQQWTTELWCQVFIPSGGKTIHKFTRPTGSFKSALTVRQDGTLDFSINDAVLASSTDKLSTWIQYCPALWSQYKAHYKVDKVLMRKYAQPPPSAAFGAEQKRIEAEVAFSPETLNIKSGGKWISAWISIPSGDPADIDISTVAIVKIQGNPIDPAIPAQAHPTEIGDFDGYGLPELMVKFDRSALASSIGGRTGSIAISISGFVAGSVFEGSGSIRVIRPGKNDHASSEDVLMPPQEFNLENYPNPFNPETTIRFAIPKSGHVHMAVYSVTGERVIVLLDGKMDRGDHQIAWNGRDGQGRSLPSGVYLCAFQSGAFRRTIRLMLIR